MTGVLVAVPWREQPSRLAPLAAVRDWYAHHLPDAGFLLVDATSWDTFNRAATRNLAVQLAEGHDVVILNDADTIPQIGPLTEAIDGCQRTGLVHLPYTECHVLVAPGTEQYLIGLPPEKCHSQWVPGAVGGTLVTTPAGWALTNGQDERFQGWGFEDAAWHMAHETLAGEPPRHEGRIYPMVHTASPRQGPMFDAGLQLVYRYGSARGGVDAMRKLVTE